MKYKIGDRVKMKKSAFSNNDSFLREHNYILTIKSYDGRYYQMEEDPFMSYFSSSIEGLEIKEIKEIYDPILTRWEILDL